MATTQEIINALDQVDGVLKNENLTQKAESETSALASGRSLTESLELLAELSEVIRKLTTGPTFDVTPFNVRRIVSTQLGNVSTHANNYINGQIPAPKLEQQIDALHTTLWQNNLLDRLEEVPGLEKKQKQLDSLRRKGRRILQELEQIQSAGAKVKELASETETVQAQLESIETAVSRVAEHQQSTQAASESAQQAEEDALSTRKEAKGSLDEINALKAKVELFYSTIEENEKKLAQIQQEAQASVSENDKRTEEVIRRNEQLQQEIDKQLQKATGASLFSAFHKRRRQITIAKWVWAALSVAGLAFSVYWGVFLAQAAQNLDTAFFIKLGGTVPLVVLLLLFVTQYGRERRMEEEYAFKAALALSLTPYKELIEKLEIAQQSDPQYAKFLVGTIGQIFQRPLAATDRDSSEDFLSVKAMKEIGNLLERVISSAK